MSVVSKYNRIAPIYELIDLPLELFFFQKYGNDPKLFQDDPEILTKYTK